MDELMVAVAAAIAGPVATAVVGEGRKALAGLVRLVKERFAREPAARAALEAAQCEPEDKDRVARLAAALDLIAVGDEAFAAQMGTLWRDVAASSQVDHGSVINTVSGRVNGQVVQARDIAGPVHLYTNMTPTARTDDAGG